MDCTAAHVAVLSWGGTILRVGANRLDQEYFDRKLSDPGASLTVEQLVEGIPELADIAQIDPIHVGSPQGVEVSPADWLRLHERITKEFARLAPEVGAVLTHGTGTLEETAYFLDLTLQAERPLVLVGSILPSNALGSDGARNFVAAVRTARDPQTWGLGVVVVIDQEIHAAREVKKSAAHALGAFSSGTLGCLGYAGPDRVTIYRRPVRTAATHGVFDVVGLAELPRVDIAYSYAGSDGTAIEAFVERGAAGIVCAGFHPGRLTPAESSAVERAIDSGVVVVQATRAGDGRVALTERCRKLRVVAADNLSPQKARILAMLALTRTKEYADIQKIFSEY